MEEDDLLEQLQRRAGFMGLKIVNVEGQPHPWQIVRADDGQHVGVGHTSLRNLNASLVDLEAKS